MHATVHGEATPGHTRGLAQVLLLHYAQVSEKVVHTGLATILHINCSPTTDTYQISPFLNIFYN